MRGSLKVSARFRWRKRRRTFFRCIVTGRNVSTSSDLASLGHLPLKGKAFFRASSQKQTATIPTKSKSYQPNFDASETERPRTTTVRVQGLTKAKYRTDASAHKQGVQGGPPWRFPPAFSEKAGPRPGGRPSGEDTPKGVALTDYNTVGPKAVRIHRASAVNLTPRKWTYYYPHWEN